MQILKLTLMRSRQITIKDIAKRLGVSPSTVSRALKDHPDISYNTRKAVQELANILGYKPNEVALSLRTSQSKIIGVIVPEIVHHFFSSIISGIEEVANEAGYYIMIFQTNESYKKELVYSQTLISSRIDGLIVSFSKETTDFEHFKSFVKNTIPIVLFDRITDELEADKVMSDDLKGAYMMVEHLIQQGCRHIAHFGSPNYLNISQSRLQGYKNALEKYQLPFDEKLVFKCDNYEDSILLTHKIFSQKLHPDALFAVNDLTAAGAIMALRKLGIKVPEEVAVAGYTNALVGKVVDPPLSTVDQHGFEMGREAARMLLHRLRKNKADTPYETRVIKTNLVLRDSTRKITD
ncbi:MAG: LacI family DNA-binding transcriptional regulator [Bacteroidales bacterium]|nr:LacI family DNA-binding transcriptional regulator [Bacteroidales bacterium]MDD3009925.1 LacI family DNA-binding transcriptional regulator [Bacteroidales bacterium]MDD3960485.1 LacI family DNA-binding transcriptional regulator [Bacteroidales bacterium]MDY0285070.1 LacI family DNA-binding transcriptional regulator [Bacteroidales bacterium]HPE86165.1 LacI family DNA-binding transcriptional regulator [Bacteroidales bacterium]